jgi:hypothetical protein
MSVMDESNEVDKLIGVTNYQLLEETRLGFGKCNDFPAAGAAGIGQCSGR